MNVFKERDQQGKGVPLHEYEVHVGEQVSVETVHGVWLMKVEVMDGCLFVTDTKNFGWLRQDAHGFLSVPSIHNIEAVRRGVLAPTE